MVQDCQTYTGLSQEREENIVQITTVQDNNNPEENQLNPMGVLKHLRGIFFFTVFLKILDIPWSEVSFKKKTLYLK